MLGTFGGALDARHIDASNGKLVGEVTGEVETEEGVLVIRRIHLAMRLLAPERRTEAFFHTWTRKEACANPRPPWPATVPSSSRCTA